MPDPDPNTEPQAAGIDPSRSVTPVPEPGMSFGQILPYLPVIEQIAAAVAGAVASGGTQIPIIDLHLGGKVILLGPIPVQVKPAGS